MYRRDGIKAIGGTPVDYGKVTTPQLHYIIRLTFMHKSPQKLEQYYEDFKQFFTGFMSAAGKSMSKEPLWVDCSDGIGGARFHDLKDHLGLSAKLVNDGEGPASKLNDGCGAEFVQKEKKFPRGFEEVPTEARCVSFDGDADRIVYLYDIGLRTLAP